MIEEARARFGLPSESAAPARPLAGDVGGRRYFRIASSSLGSVLLVLYPEPHSTAQESWRIIGAALTAAGLRVPRLHDDAPDLGAALIEDLGDCDLSAELQSAPDETRPFLLDEAEELLAGVRSLPRAVALRNPVFDTEFFMRELAHTRVWALEAGGAEPLSAARAADWDDLASRLARAAADPLETGDPVPTHRDYHANNLLRAPDGRLSLIDFQDLRLGPPDYDPVSLRFERAGEAVPPDASAYSEAVLLQRAWKVLGTFEKMLRMGRDSYRPHRDATLRVLSRHTSPRGPYAGMLSFLS